MITTEVSSEIVIFYHRFIRVGLFFGGGGEEEEGEDLESPNVQEFTLQAN